MEGHRLAYLEFWKDGKTGRDEYIELTDETYSSLVVDPNTGKIISDRPWVIIFILPFEGTSVRLKEAAESMAATYKGAVQFAWVNRVREEWLWHSY